jgi:hypothetical protein
MNYNTVKKQALGNRTPEQLLKSFKIQLRVQRYKEQADKLFIFKANKFINHNINIDAEISSNSINSGRREIGEKDQSVQRSHKGISIL